MTKLSIVIPVFNEKETFLSLLEKVEKVKIPKVEKEIIIVDDKSTDGTRELLKEIKTPHTILFHKKNQGKGAALRTGFKKAKGDIIVVQDADLEYNPADIKKLIKPILRGKTDVVYGSRFLNAKLKLFNKKKNDAPLTLHR